MQDISDILHVEGTFCAFNTPNHVIRCHLAAFAAGCMQAAKCNLHEKVENRLFARESNFAAISKKVENRLFARESNFAAISKEMCITEATLACLLGLEWKG